MTKTLVKELNVIIPKSQISTITYKINKSSSNNVEIRISEEGDRVLLHGDSEEVLEEHFDQLLKLIKSKENWNSNKALLYELPHKKERFFTINHFLNNKQIMIGANNNLILQGYLVELFEIIDKKILTFAEQVQAKFIYSEPIWADDNLGLYGYQPNDHSLCTLGNFDKSVNKSNMWQIAACNNIWHNLSGKSVQAAETYTIKGICCRNEGNQYNFLERMRVFTMREITFLGTRKQTYDFKEKALNFLITLASELELTGYIENANDPFFVGTHSTKHDYDLPQIIKQELRLNVSLTKTIAVSSINIHGNFFSKNLDIKLDSKEEPWTCCFAFGLERWLWAIMTQLGQQSQNLITKKKYNA
ncbi:hypothetical protein QU600_001842 [Orientia tsutsugamushi]|uniref:hypothetical protein n=1 Tax=Orientia tsutsugamushi TaxID=784 RepID=UPI00315D83A1